MLTMCYQVLQYGESQYIRQFGMDIPHPTQLTELDGRIIRAPRLNYNPKSKQPKIVGTFHPSRMTKCTYLHKATRKWGVEYVGRFS